MELIKLVPGNPLVRALILRFTGEMPPAECVAFEALKEWVEAKARVKRRPMVDGGTGDGVVIAVRFSDTECGRASYSTRRHGNEDYHLDEVVLLGMAQSVIDDGGGLSELVDAVVRDVGDNAW